MASKGSKRKVEQEPEACYEIRHTGPYQFHVVLVSVGNTEDVMWTETYRSSQAANKAIDWVKEHAADAPVVRVEVEPEPDPEPETEPDPESAEEEHPLLTVPVLDKPLTAGHRAVLGLS